MFGRGTGDRERQYGDNGPSRGIQPGEDLSLSEQFKDVVLEVGVTPNRSDCLSIIGIAREIAALTGKDLRYPEITFTETDEDIDD